MPENTIPQAVELERSVIGALLQEPNRIADVVKILSPESFYDEKNTVVYRTLLDMFDNNTPVDLFVVGKRCEKSPLFEDRAGIMYVTGCYTEAGTGTDLVYKAQIIAQMYILRLLMSAGLRIHSLASDDKADVADVLDETNNLIDKINALSCGNAAERSIRDSISEALRRTERRQEARKAGLSCGIPTGISDLDRLTGGWKGSQLIVLAARPSMGKTALMLHFAKVAARYGTPVCIFSLEMSHVSLSDRLLLSECDVEADSYRNGDLSAEDWQELESATARLEKLPIHVDDNAVVSMRYIKTRCQILQKRGKCGMIMIDYLQLADTSTGQRNRNREQEIAQASRQAKIDRKSVV